MPDAGWGVPRDTVLENIREIVDAVDLPVNADFESGYARDLEALTQNVQLCVETGVAGLSIEDATGDPARPLFDLPIAVERMRAARAAIDASQSGVLLTGRAECFLVGHTDPFAECVRRLTAYAEAGADVLYAPGIDKREEIKSLIAALPAKPVNILMSRHSGITVADLAELGVRRISVGSSLARATWTGFIGAATAIAKEGSFRGFDGLTPYRELNAFFRGLNGDISGIQAPLETVLRAKRIHLACYREADAPRLWELIANNRDRLIESFPILLSTVRDEASAREFIRALVSDFTEKKRYGFSIRKSDDNTIIGHCIIREIDWTVPKGEVGYWIDAAHEGKGYAREAVNALVNFAFKTLDMKKLFLRAVPLNRRSLDLAEKCGFSKEGYLKDEFRTGTGAVSDIVYFGLTRKDFLTMANNSVG